MYAHVFTQNNKLVDLKLAYMFFMEHLMQHSKICIKKWMAFMIISKPKHNLIVQNWNACQSWIRLSSFARLLNIKANFVLPAINNSLVFSARFNTFSLFLIHFTDTLSSTKLAQKYSRFHLGLVIREKVQWEHYENVFDTSGWSKQYLQVVWGYCRLKIKREQKEEREVSWALWRFTLPSIPWPSAVFFEVICQKFKPFIFLENTSVRKCKGAKNCVCVCVFKSIVRHCTFRTACASYSSKNDQYLYKHQPEHDNIWSNKSNSVLISNLYTYILQ